MRCAISLSAGGGGGKIEERDGGRSWMNLSISIKLAMLNIMKEGLTDVEVFSRPFELQYLEDEKYFSIIENIVKDRFKKAFDIIEQNKDPFIALKELKVHSLRTILVHKKTFFDFRKCGYIDPLDEIVYLTLAIILSNKIEKQRIHKKSNIVYSYRLKPNLINEKEPTYLFDQVINYTSFRTSISQKAKETGAKVIVSCDIANFYDRLNLHKLENTLLSVEGIDRAAVSLVNQLLLYWSNRDSYGLPVGSNASRILAEASLLNIDRYLREKNIKYSRYVDDFRLFAKDAREAHTWLSILVERLNQDGLFLNTSKTSLTEAPKDIKVNPIQEPKEKPLNDTVMEKKDMPIIVRGYSGLIPTKFRKLSNREALKLRETDMNDMLKKINIDLVDPKDLIKYIRVLVAGEKWAELAETCSVLNRFPHFIPYYLNCIERHAERFITYKDKIIDIIIELTKDPNILEYLRIYMIRFLCSEHFQSKTTVIECYNNLRRGEGVYLGRAILENLQGLTNRDDLLEIKEDFLRADSAEKRQILRLLKEGFNDVEFRTFYKNISLNDNDPWYEFIAGTVVARKTSRNLKKLDGSKK
jgi:hypothetical protein